MFSKKLSPSLFSKTKSYEPALRETRKIKPAIASGRGGCDLSVDCWTVVGVPEGAMAGCAGRTFDHPFADADAEIGRSGWLRWRNVWRWWANVLVRHF